MLAGQSLNKKNHSETQMNFWKKSLFYQTLFILILCLYACTLKSPGGPTIQRLRIRLASEVPSIDHTLTGDATSRDIITTLHEGLLRLDEKNKAVNGLAESWTTSRDQKNILTNSDLILNGVMEKILSLKILLMPLKELLSRKMLLSQLTFYFRFKMLLPFLKEN